MNSSAPPTDIPVFYEAFDAGHIVPGEDGPSFHYDARWRASPGAFPISLTMPIEQKAFSPRILLPWLQNLLPEGDPLKAIARLTGISTDDVLGMIERIGRDTAGAFSIGRSRVGTNPGYIPVRSDEDLERIIADLPRKPFLVNEDGVSMSLAGAQEKLPVTLVDDRIAIPRDGAASTHILKPAADKLHGSVWNEALCMTLARRVGLNVARVTTGLAGKTAYLLVTRYDRVREGDVVRRIHQEDFCQALGRFPGAKYEHSQGGFGRGPGIADFFELARRLTPGQVRPLLDAIIFNVLIGNVDSHAKNYSIVFPFNALELPHLAPLYDLMSGLSWANITKNHAQDVGGQRDGRHIEGRHWKRMAKSARIGPSLTVKRVRELADAVVKETNAAVADVKAMPAGDYAFLDVFAKEIKDRAALVLANLDREKPDENQTVDENLAEGLRLG